MKRGVRNARVFPLITSIADLYLRHRKQSSMPVRRRPSRASFSAQGVRMEKHEELDYRTTVQMLSDWRERKLLERAPTLAERLLGYFLPGLWLFAIVVAGAAISW